jgi:hypothetical protein
MAIVVLFKPNQMPEMHRDARVQDYVDNQYAVIDPIFKFPVGTPIKYWVRGRGRYILEAGAAQKAVIDQDLLQKEQDMVDKFEKLDAMVLAKALVKNGTITKAKLLAAIRFVLNNP